MPGMKGADGRWRACQMALQKQAVPQQSGKFGGLPRQNPTAEQVTIELCAFMCFLLSQQK